MDFDFLSRDFVKTAEEAVAAFRQTIEEVEPPEGELERLCDRLTVFDHCTRLEQDFVVAGVDGSGEFPVIQQDDIFMHFVVSAGAVFETCTKRQHKLSVHNMKGDLYTGLIILRDLGEGVLAGYRGYLNEFLSMDLHDLVDRSDYCAVFSAEGRKPLTPGDVQWDQVAISRASQVATHAYMIRSLAELGMAVRCLAQKPRYLLLDTSLVYFLLGETIYLPELLKRHLICQANEQGTGVLGLCKSHGIPNGDLLGRWATERFGAKDHWFLRLPSASLGEPIPVFLQDREVPPKLGVSYLFKFHDMSFPMRLDVDAGWWRTHIKDDAAREKQLFQDLDYTCHDVRSYGYPYPLQSAHRKSSLTRKERRAVRDILFQFASKEGILRGAFMRTQEDIHQAGL
jgi:hypothetical protein